MSAASYRTMVLASSPLLYYPMDDATGPFIDIGSEGQNATVNGTGMLYQQTDSWAGTESCKQSTTAGYVSVADFANLDFAGNFTLEFLLNWSGVEQDKHIISRWTGLGATMNWYISMHYSSVGQLRFLAYLNSAQKPVENSRTVNDGKWHHVAGVYDGSNLYLYIDGTPGTGVAATGALLSNTNGFTLFRLTDYDTNNAVCSLSHLALYSTALSAETIKNHYAESIGISRDIQKSKVYANIHNRYWL